MLPHKVIVFGVLAAASAWAAACGEWLPKHGGIMNLPGEETAFELVAKGKVVVIHIEDHGTPVPTAGSRAVLHVERESTAWTAVLEPEGENRLRTVLAEELAPGDRLRARVTLADGSIAGGRFVFSLEAQRLPVTGSPMPGSFRFR